MLSKKSANIADKFYIFRI